MSTKAFAQTNERTVISSSNFVEESSSIWLFVNHLCIRVHSFDEIINSNSQVDLPPNELQFAKIQSKQTRVSLAELSIGQSITKRIDRTVQIAKKVTSMKKISIKKNTFATRLAKGLNNRMDVPLEMEMRALMQNRCRSDRFDHRWRKNALVV